MKTFKQYSNLAIISMLFMLTIFAAGCGSDNTTNPPQNSISLSGTAVDGYISGATVCLDVDSSGICESTEPTTTTAADGSFSFTNVEVADNLLFPVIVSGGIDTATNKLFIGEIKNIINSATITADAQLNVTPLTDLIAVSFLQSTIKSVETFNNSKTEIADVFGISEADVTADPMTNVFVFAKSQEVQQIKALIEITASKAKDNHLSAAEKLVLQNAIKEALVTQIKATIGTNLEIDKVLAEVESKSSITIPDNEKIFVAAEVAKVQTTLDLATSSTTTDKLNELQTGLEAELIVAVTSINDALAEETITVVDISDSAQLITQGETIKADTITPTVTSMEPNTNATNVSINKNISVLFNESLTPSTVNTTTFSLATTSGATAVDGTVSYSGNTIVFNPIVNLSAGTEYTATITTDVKDLAGNALAVAKVWSFTTGTIEDTVAPTVTSMVPNSNATNVSTDRSVSVLFSESLNPSTVKTTTVSLATTIGATAVDGTVSYSGNTIVFNPIVNLSAGTEYTATITTGVKDLAGNALAVAKVWSFTTASAPIVPPPPPSASGPSPVNLGTAGNFVILAKTAVSTTGATAITGDVGVSPAAQTYVTGFSETLDSTTTFATSPLVTGKIYAADMTSPTSSNLTTAVSNMETAYTDAAGRTTPDYTELGAGDVSGKTLAPGLYKWGTGVLITDVGVTISGSATDTWIFQIAGDLTVNNGAIVTLAGGALAKNIFWQVAGGTGVSLGTTSQFKGVVLAQKGIVVNTGATVNGRLLAQTAVTLNANAVTQP